MLMTGFAARAFATLCVALILIAPVTALAQPQCSADQPRLAPQFGDLVTRLGSRTGNVTECEHTDAASGDLQQSTSTGLLYLRQASNTPTFTDGGEHWALRTDQLVEWSTDDVDPPASAQVVPSAATPETGAPTAVPRQIATTPASIGVPDLTGFGIAAAISVVVLAIVAAFGLTVLRRGPSAKSWVVQPGTQLATSTAPMSGLQSTITDIGDGRVTAYADDILHRDAEQMVLQQRPFALAVLLPSVAKWLVAMIVAVVVGVATGLSVIPLAVVAVAAIALVLAYAPLSATEYRVTSQRIEITTGVLARHKVTREVFELGDAAIDQPLHYRIFGVGNLRIAYRQGGAVVLQAIQNAEGVRDVLRGTGQFEAARFDKARWR
jgi:hypothetical protein